MLCLYRESSPAARSVGCFHRVWSPRWGAVSQCWAHLGPRSHPAARVCRGLHRSLAVWQAVCCGHRPWWGLQVPLLHQRKGKKPHAGQPFPGLRAGGPQARPVQAARAGGLGRPPTSESSLQAQNLLSSFLCCQVGSFWQLLAPSQADGQGGDQQEVSCCGSGLPQPPGSHPSHTALGLAGFVNCNAFLRAFVRVTEDNSAWRKWIFLFHIFSFAFLFLLSGFKWILENSWSNMEREKDWNKHWFLQCNNLWYQLNKRCDMSSSLSIYHMLIVFDTWIFNTTACFWYNKGPANIPIKNSRF